MKKSFMISFGVLLLVSLGNYASANTIQDPLFTIETDNREWKVQLADCTAESSCSYHPVVRDEHKAAILSMIVPDAATPDLFVASYLETYKQRGTKITLKDIIHTSTERLMLVNKVDDLSQFGIPGLASETEVLKLVQGVNGVKVLSYTVNDVPITDESLSQWAEYFKNSPAK